MQVADVLPSKGRLTQLAEEGNCPVRFRLRVVVLAGLPQHNCDHLLEVCRAVT